MPKKRKLPRGIKKAWDSYQKNMQKAAKAAEKLMQGGYMNYLMGGKTSYMGGGYSMPDMYATGGQVRNAMATGYGNSHVNTAAAMFGHDPRKENYMNSSVHGWSPIGMSIGYPMRKMGGTITPANLGLNKSAHTEPQQGKTGSMYSRDYYPKNHMWGFLFDKFPIRDQFMRRGGSMYGSGYYNKFFDPYALVGMPQMQRGGSTYYGGTLPQATVTAKDPDPMYRMMYSDIERDYQTAPAGTMSPTTYFNAAYNMLGDGNDTIPIVRKRAKANIRFGENLKKKKGQKSIFDKMQMGGAMPQQQGMPTGAESTQHMAQLAQGSVPQDPMAQQGMQDPMAQQQGPDQGMQEQLMQLAQAIVAGDEQAIQMLEQLAQQDPQAAQMVVQMVEEMQGGQQQMVQPKQKKGGKVKKRKLKSKKASYNPTEAMIEAAKQNDPMSNYMKGGKMKKGGMKRRKRKLRTMTY